MNLPTYNESQVTPNTLPTPNFNTGDPMAQAGERLGGQIERSSGQMFDLARETKIKADSSVVMDSYVNFSKNALNIQNDALNKKGKDALNFENSVLDFDQSLSEVRDKLTPDQQRIFDMKTEHERINFETSLHRHANEQGDALNKTNAAANVDIAEQQLSTNYKDPSQYNISDPKSYINALRASVADQMHMHGITDKDPAFKDAIDKATSKAYVDRIKLMMFENPTEANNFFKEHENEIELVKREALKKEVTHQSDEKAGTDAAFAMLPDIKDGKKTETDLNKEMYDKFKDNPGALKHAQVQLKQLFTQNHADQVNASAGQASKIESQIDDAMSKGQVISTGMLRNIPEYQELSKLAASGNKPAEVELSKLRTYAAKVGHQQKQEAKADARDARAEKHEARQQFMLNVADPETLKTMTETQIVEEGRKNGLSFAQINQLKSTRQKELKTASNPAEMHNMNITSQMMNDVLEKGAIPKEQRDGFGKAWRAAIKAKENELGRPMTVKEIQEAGLQGLQYHATNNWFGAKGEWKAEQGATDRPWAKDTAFNARIAELKKKRPNVKLTDDRMQKLYEEYKKE